MRHPVARWVVLVLAAAVAVGLGYRANQLEQQGAASRRDLVASTTEAQALQSALSDARRGVAAMVSAGQPAVSWSRQTNAAIDLVRTRLASLAALPAGAALSSSRERLDRLVEAKGRLHDAAVGGRSLIASDIAFGEALPHLDAIVTQVADVVAVMNADAERAATAARQQQALAVAGALGVLALAALILTPISPRPVDEAPAPAVEPERLATHDLPLDLDRSSGAAVMADASSTSPASLDLSPLAAVCGELARLSDGAALASVLERVAPAIGAKGIVVWLADADHNHLQPAAAWGYDPRLVARFPAVSVGDDNPTAHAFSSATLDTVPGRAGQPAAVTAPIVGSKGAVGVLSVELTSSGAPTAETAAAAGIIAAQLATLFEPQPKRDTPATDVPQALQG